MAFGSLKCESKKRRGYIEGKLVLEEIGKKVKIIIAECWNQVVNNTVVHVCEEGGLGKGREAG